MKRLTDRTADGIAYVKSETGVEGVGASTTQRRLPELIARLAAYEDTGLEPEEISELLLAGELSPEAKYTINEHADNLIKHLDALLHKDDGELKKYRALGSLDHLKERVQAENDGRLVVLPEVTEPTRAKIEFPFHKGDRIYIVDKRVRGSIRVTRLESYLVYTENPVRVLVKCTANSSWHELKNVYATRKEATAALAEKGTENA